MVLRLAFKLTFFFFFFFLLQQAKEMVLELIRDQGGFREVRNEYGSRIGGNEGIDVSKNANSKMVE